MTQTSTNIDGRYILFPDGGAWEYARIRGGALVSHTEESNLATHVAADDSPAWLGDIDFDALTPLEDEHRVTAVLTACGRGDRCPESVAVCPIDSNN